MRKPRQHILLMIILIVSIFAASCGGQSTVTSTNTNPTPTPENNSNTDIDVKKTEVKVIYDFANDINIKEYTAALDKLETSLSGIYSMDNNAPLRNIEKMQISKLIDKTNSWNVDAYIKDFYAYKVYYAEVDYKINNIISSDFKDGIFYHKIVTVQVTKDSPWQIAEMSTSPDKY